jgi:hypothetical protein
MDACSQACPVHSMLTGPPEPLVLMPTANAIPPGPAAMPFSQWKVLFQIQSSGPYPLPGARHCLPRAPPVSQG